MRIINSSVCFQTPTLMIGRRGENAVTQVVFDYSSWEALFGTGVIDLYVKRSGDAAAYPVVLNTDTPGTAIWTITNVDTNVIGKGKAELTYTINEQLAKSYVMSFEVLEDIGQPTSDPPDPYESWLETLGELGAITEANAQAAERAQEAAETAQEKAETAQGKAEDAQTAAETAQEKAEAAQTAAETAQGKAEDAQTAAETAQGKAEDAEDAAVEAQGKAEDAQAAAEAARDEILDLDASATVDANVGTPSVEVSVSVVDDHKQMDFAFHNLKGEKGDKGDTGNVYFATFEVIPSTGILYMYTDPGYSGANFSLNNAYLEVTI